MKKIWIVALVALAGVALAGFDQYNSKNYLTALAPTPVANSASVVTNASPLDIAGLPGNGSLVFQYSCANDAAAVLSFSIKTSATTNGTYTTWTNADGVSSWTYTNSSGNARILFRPNTVSRYLRVFVTPTAVTNGVAGALLVTE